MVYEISPVQMFELVQVLTDGEKRQTRLVGVYKSVADAEKYRDRYKLHDEVFADSGFAEQEI